MVVVDPYLPADNLEFYAIPDVLIAVVMSSNVFWDTM
jgi:hypothetical protein